MKGIARFVVETLLLMLLAGGMLIAAILIAQHAFTDEKSQYFVLGCYVASHNDLVRWIWKKLRVEKASPA